MSETCETCRFWRTTKCAAGSEEGRYPAAGEWCAVWQPKGPATRKDHMGSVGNVESWPSVTQVMSPWTAQALAAIPEMTLAAAADRGTDVHHYCAKIAQGEFVLVLPSLEGYVQSFERWHDHQVEEVILTERRLYDEGLCFHGKPDLIVRLVDGRLALVDLKTPVAHQKSWGMQLAAYKRLADINGYHVDVAGTLRLDPAGKTPKMKWYEDSGPALTAFVAALSVWNFLH